MKKTEREMLVLAAKAAGINLADHQPVLARDGQSYLPPVLGRWEPLKSDGDAMRLAAKLKIDLEWQHDDDAVEAYIRNDEGRFYCPIYPASEYKRAILDVAANLGKSMP